MKIDRNKELSIDVNGLLYLEYTFTPNILMSHETIVMYEYFSNKQTLIDRRTFLGKDMRYSDFHDGQAYMKDSKLHPSQL